MLSQKARKNFRCFTGKENQLYAEVVEKTCRGSLLKYLRDASVVILMDTDTNEC